jgi:hypothetical protein
MEESRELPQDRWFWVWLSIFTVLLGTAPFIYWQGYRWLGIICALASLGGLLGLIRDRLAAVTPIRTLLKISAVAIFLVLIGQVMGYDIINRQAIPPLGIVRITVLIGCVCMAVLVVTLAPRIQQKQSQPPEVDEFPRPLPISSASLPLAIRPETEAQDEKREMVNVTPEYLIGFYHEGHTSVQARKLAEAFIGKWMTVAGSIGDVLGNYEHQRMVVFSDRSIHTHNHVNMFFRDKQWFGELSTIKRGDAIAVRGQINEVNSVEISLENCELVDEKQ